MPFEPELAKRIHYYALPSADFDPATATERTLEDFGLPAKPPEDQVGALAFWEMLFSKPLRFVRPSFAAVAPAAQLFSDFDRQAGHRYLGQGASNHRRFERSRNWSGVYLRPGRGHRFVSVAAAWRVPDPGLPDVSPIDPSPNDPARNEFRSSVWVGLNGHRAYPHVTMPQIGTWQRARPASGGLITDIAAWWQWWSNDAVTPIVKFENIRVSAGHVILAAVVVVSSDEVIFYIKNQSTGDLAWLLVQAPLGSEPLGTTAEWIVERPTTPGHVWPWRMPKLTDVEMSNCYALSSQRVIGPRSLHTFARASFIRMQERFPNPYRSAIIMVPERTSNSSMRVRFREARKI